MRVRNVDISSPAQKRMVKSPRDEMRLKATVEGRQVHYRLEFPPTSCSPLAVDSVLPWGSAELGILQSLLIIMTLRR